MRIIDIIEKKKLGKALNEEEIKFFIDGVSNNTIEDYQISALLMAIYFTGMNIEETTFLTKYMAESGEMLDLSDISSDIIDKHSTGGVGDKITLIFLPLMAAANLYTAKLSGRGLGHTGGTIDKLESIPGFNTNLSIDEFKNLVKINHTAISSQTPSLAPADGKLYMLRDVTSTVDIIPLIASSVVSKKIASGANHIILDVKYGKGAFLKTKEDALKLSKIMVEIGKRLNKNISAVISDMNMPLGRAIGNSIEVIEVIEFLKGNMLYDLKEITYTLCLEAFNKIGIHKDDKYLDDLIYSGKALQKFKEIIQYQNGNTDVINDYKKFKHASFCYKVKSEKEGYINNIDAMSIAKACKILGAGRDKKSDAIDHSAGIYLSKHYSEFVKKDDTIAVLYTDKENVIDECKSLIINSFEFSDIKPDNRKLIYNIVY